MIAAIEAWRAGLFHKSHLAHNLVAGLVVGVVALPLAMAFAIASGARPEQGIYTGIVAGIIAALFGSSRVSISGPTGAFIAVLAGITLQYGIDGLQIASFMAGLILLAMGWAKLGGIIRFIPTPVITGFTAGIAIIIFVGQWKDFFGLHPLAAGQHFHEKLIALLQAMPTLDIPTTLLAAELRRVLAYPEFKLDEAAQTALFVRHQTWISVAEVGPTQTALPRPGRSNVSATGGIG